MSEYDTTHNSLLNRLLLDFTYSESANINKDRTKYYELELGQVVERFNAIETFRIQLGTFFGTANLTALGFRFSAQNAGIIIIAATTLLIFMLVDQRLRLLTIAYLFRGIQIQRKLAPDDTETFLQILPSNVAKQAKMIADLKARDERIKSLETASNYFVSKYFFIILLTFVGEIIVGLALWLYRGWSFF